MFAGPNGSGKSTIKNVVPSSWLGIYLNPDEMQAEIEARGYLDLQNYGVNTTSEEILAFFTNSRFLQKEGMGEEAQRLRFAEGKLSFHPVVVNAYFASVAADFIRRKLLQERISFSLETVMSSPDKVELLESAQQLGYRTYLYYIATDDPAINAARVQARVNQGGHDVPADKIVTRYERSLDLLLQAVRHSNRAYLFDNSCEGGQRLLVAEVNDGFLELRRDPMPRWFQKAIWEKINPPSRFHA